MISLKANIKDETNLIEDIREHLLDRKEGIHYNAIIRDIFMLANVDDLTGKSLVNELLSNEPDFYSINDYWYLKPSNQLNSPVDGLTFVVVDLETTGGGTKNHRIIELGAVKIHNRKIIETFETFINPERDIPDYVTKITGINIRMLEGAPRIQEVIPGFLRFLGNHVLVAHNLSYDLGFMNASLFRMGYKHLYNLTLCTLELSRLLLPEIKNHKLEDVTGYFNIQIARRHRALDDARGTALLLIEFIEMLEEAGVNTFEKITDLLPQKKRLDVSELMVNKHDIHALADKPGVFRMVDSHGEIIYVNSADNVRKRVRDLFYAKEKEQTMLMKQMVRQVAKIEQIPTSSHIKAKLDANNLMDIYHPKFNLLQKTGAPMLLVTETINGLQTEIAHEFFPQRGEYYGPVFKNNQLNALISLPVNDLQLEIKFEYGNEFITVKKNKAGKQSGYNPLYNYDLTLYLTETIESGAIELIFLQNNLLLGQEKCRIMDESIDTLKDILAKILKEYLQVTLIKLPRIHSNVDIIKAKSLKTLDFHPSSYKKCMNINFNRVNLNHLLNEIIKRGFRLINRTSYKTI